MDRDIYAKLIAKIKSLATKINGMGDAVGDLNDLTTTAKTNVVAAINEVNGMASQVGALSNLTTTSKTSVVSAINEVDGAVTPLGTVKSKQLDVTSIAASDIADLTGTLSTPADYGFVVGYKIQNNASIIPLKLEFTDKSTIAVRLRNLASAETTSGNIIVYYV